MISDFYPRSPCGERHIKDEIFSTIPYFYPRSPCGERPDTAFKPAGHILFLSTLSLRRATPTTTRDNKHNIFLSTLSLRRATREPTALRTPHQRFLSTLSLRRATSVQAGRQDQPEISIHALLAESDLKPPVQTHRQKNFYPRSPCGERRRHRGNDGRPVHFYPRSPCGERLCCTPKTVTPM